MTARGPALRAGLLLPGLLLACTLTACSGDRPSLAGADPAPANTLAEPGKVAIPDTRAVDTAVVATAVVPLVAIYASPDAPEPVATLDNPLAGGGPLVLLVDRTIDGWHEVLLPSGGEATGWLRAADVTTTRHNYRIEVHLSDLRLDVYLHGQIARQVKVTAGNDAPLAAGTRSYTTELEQREGAMLAYVLSGTGLRIRGRDGTVATGIVLPEQDIEDLATFLPLGVPVSVLP
jgi:hypothetical protein